MIIYVKRYPNETEYSRIVAKMRQHHSYLSIIASIDSSGGSHPETLYDLASKTNGVCAFDYSMDLPYDLFYDENVVYPYLIYAANPQVSGKGSIQLSPLLIPKSEYYWFTMMQDTAPITGEQTLMLIWYNDNEQWQMGSNGTYHCGELFQSAGNHLADREYLSTDSYNVRLVFNYPDSEIRTVQIRVNQPDYAINYWIPYDN
ncbi:hypothetical protein CAEBREN_22882 [Caenorhabditis brenneri]|uniref:DUF7154 domain-containing protein n=1 Tax=Caenorhabditis brenneri TaxID=135651 RepID=G0P835_CAEBE|nr:hypothetical protein CAEBREN_22882 [Caenorhabditis brenneri]